MSTDSIDQSPDSATPDTDTAPAGDTAERKRLSPADLDHILRHHRDFLFENLYALGRVVNMVADSLDVRDYTGLVHHTRQLVAYTRAIRDVVKMAYTLHREHADDQ
jgi:hypothetical protein